MAKKVLASPFVPVEEQPYPIPENWCWTYIGNCYEVTSSKRVHKEDWKDSGVPFYRTRELVKLSENGYVENELFIANELYEKLVADYGKPKIGDILISGVGTIGVPFIVKENTSFYFKDGNIIWFQCKGICLPEYIFYLYKSNFMSNLIHDMSAGTTVDTYTIINANRTVFPLPPLAEQKRIVARIESLFAKLDEAKEKAQAVVDGFELRKSAILHKAFTGELTEQWRKEHGVGLDSWKVIPFGNLILSGPQNGLYKPKDAYGSGTKILRIDGFYDGYIEDWETLKRLTLSAAEIKLYELHLDEIVINRVNSMPYLGKSALIRELSETCVFESNMMRISLKKECVIPEFIIRYLNSPVGLAELRKNAKQAVNQASINQKDVKSVIVQLPTLDEQEEIVRILDCLLTQEQQAKEAAEAVLAQIDTMKKAILARAFRGELGTNDPAEEWAGEMVKAVL